MKKIDQLKFPEGLMQKLLSLENRCVTKDLPVANEIIPANSLSLPPEVQRQQINADDAINSKIVKSPVSNIDNSVEFIPNEVGQKRSFTPNDTEFLKLQKTGNNVIKEGGFDLQQNIVSEDSVTCDLSLEIGSQSSRSVLIQPRSSSNHNISGGVGPYRSSSDQRRQNRPRPY